MTADFLVADDAELLAVASRSQAPVERFSHHWWKIYWPLADGASWRMLHWVPFRLYMGTSIRLKCMFLQKARPDNRVCRTFAIHLQM